MFKDFDQIIWWDDQIGALNHLNFPEGIAFGVNSFQLCINSFNKRYFALEDYFTQENFCINFLLYLLLLQSKQTKVIFFSFHGIFEIRFITFHLRFINE